MPPTPYPTPPAALAVKPDPKRPAKVKMTPNDDILTPDTVWNSEISIGCGLLGAEN